MNVNPCTSAAGALVSGVLIAGTLTSCVVTGMSGDEGDPPDGSMPVVLDYSTTISDTGALLYLASHPDVDLLAVTLPGTGEADCVPGTRTTRALLHLAGRPDVPVGCGRDEPLAGNRDWPADWRDLANRFPGVILPTVAEAPVDDAAQLLVDTLAGATAPVTLVAVGPLTNVAVVLASRPDLAERVERIVVMGGAVDVPGNVAAALDAEWNLYVDPEAARQVIAAGVDVVFVPLDATDELPWTDDLVRWLGLLETPAGRAEHQLVTARESLEGIFLWDELAAIAAVRSETVTLEERTVTIDDDGAIRADPGGVTVGVAVDADVETATDEFLRVLNGGTLPVVDPLTAAESTYLAALGDAANRFDAELATIFSGEPAVPATDDPRTAAAEIVRATWDAVGALRERLAGLEPPAALAGAGTQLVAAVDAVVAFEPHISATLASIAGSDPREMVFGAMAQAVGNGADPFAAINAACRRIDDYSLLRGGPAVCGEMADG